MKRLVLLLTITTMALLLVAGAALAATVNCNGGRCKGTNNADTMFGSAKRDIINSLRGGDLVRGAGGGDLVNGDGGRDRLEGGRSNDTVNGDAGNDIVAGNSGNDRMTGGSGNDRMEAADGETDRVFCGTGRQDVAVFDRGIDILSRCEIRVPRR